ncbi:unnamed protein product [Toxocara canis]|uniref:Uncharacterized protein n=1 Tax=Toxocara canis TaxID=6265 RepID=A0A183U6F5_TOXCA|nr:unnamed protein product [Toxocara canis]
MGPPFKIRFFLEDEFLTSSNSARLTYDISRERSASAPNYFIRTTIPTTFVTVGGNFVTSAGLSTKTIANRGGGGEINDVDDLSEIIKTNRKIPSAEFNVERSRTNEDLEGGEGRSAVVVPTRQPARLFGHAEAATKTPKDAKKKLINASHGYVIHEVSALLTLFLPSLTALLDQ